LKQNGKLFVYVKQIQGANFHTNGFAPRLVLTEGKRQFEDNLSVVKELSTK